jgi:NAD(P)-dependent dehydrogenase (short-subunit alcohol dehydrogenase family)
MQNKVAVITGGAKGIGEACSRVFHAKGASVAILDTDTNAGEQLAGELGERAQFWKCDVSDAATVSRVTQEVIDRFGEIDVLVNNAGIMVYHTVTEATEEEWDKVLGVNLKGAFLCAKYMIPSMLRNNGGVVINVASVQAFITQARVAAYTTSKTALLGFTRSIAVDYAPKVRAVAVCPGTIDTPMFRDAIQESPNPEEVHQECIDMHLLKRIGVPDQVGQLVAYLASDNAAFITGQAFRIDGGLGIAVGGSKRD